MRAAAAAFLLATVLAGCGGGSGGGTTNRMPVRPAQQVLAAAVFVARRASSVHVSGKLVSEQTPLQLDLTLARGKGAKGTVTQSGVSFDLVQLGGKVYIQGSDAFWQRYAPTVASLLHGHWIVAPAGKTPFAELAPLTSASRLFGLVASSHGRLVNDGLTTFDGQKVAQIRDTSDGSKLYVAATGAPYPVALAGGRKHAADQLRFDRWNAQVSLSAPPHALDLAQLGVGLG
jgi:hypothetical protein